MNEMANEWNTDLIVAFKLKAAGIEFSPNGSSISEIKKALKSASKRGNGRNGYAKWLNRYVGLFFVACSDMNEAKFSHGYKWTPERIRRSLVSLPVGANNKPDYAFMEAYIKGREKALLMRYSAFVKRSIIPHRG